MKRLLLSISIGFLLITAYAIVSSSIIVLSKQNLTLTGYLDLPVRLPKIVFYYFSPPIAEDFSFEVTQRRIFVGLFAYIANVLLYSIPAYILLTVISRTRRRISTRQMEPPEPPLFTN